MTIIHLIVQFIIVIIKFLMIQLFVMEKEIAIIQIIVRVLMVGAD
jgi:hypothetical protein